VPEKDTKTAMGRGDSDTVVFKFPEIPVTRRLQTGALAMGAEERLRGIGLRVKGGGTAVERVSAFYTKKF
jgi:hypothetical protein